MERRIGVVRRLTCLALTACGAALVACGDGGPGPVGDFTGTWKSAPVCSFASGIGVRYTLVLVQTGSTLTGTLDRNVCEGYEGPVSGTVSHRAIELTVGPGIWRAELAPGAAEVTFREESAGRQGQYRFTRQ